MKSDDFWAVEVGVRMGPLVLGTECEALLEVLREHHIDVDRMPLGRPGKVAVPEIGTQLLFSPTSPRVLERIDVSDERVRFGSLVVIGKRAHEIVGLFKVPRKEKLWCGIEPDANVPVLNSQDSPTDRSRELLAGGTIWITSLGLGLTLRDGLVATVHLCDPTHSPRSGSGLWTKEQQLLSEVRELPAASMVPTRRNRMSIWTALVHLVFFVAMGTLVWWAFRLQQRWDAAIEAKAIVVALDPPPPSVLPTNITVSFPDASGNERRHTLGFMQFLMTPKLGDEVSVRFLPESPEKVLGPVASRNVGFETAFPYGMGIFAIYCVLQLIGLGRLRFRPRQKASR